MDSTEEKLADLGNINLNYDDDAGEEGYDEEEDEYKEGDSDLNEVNEQADSSMTVKTKGAKSKSTKRTTRKKRSKNKPKPGPSSLFANGAYELAISESKIAESEALDDDDPDAATRRKLLSRSQRLMEQRFQEREAVKRELLQSRADQRAKLQRQRIKSEVTWKAKLEKSPFLVNLIAENERIEEENKARLEEAARHEMRIERRRSKVKNDIILKALQEASDLDALRAEKRLIMEEERRLKALIEVEKTNLNRKQDLMAAMRAEKQRKQMQQEFRRQKRMQFEKEMREQRKLALKAKLGLEDPSP